MYFVFDVKHDGRYKTRLVADGQLTDIPLESVFRCSTSKRNPTCGILSITSSYGQHTLEKFKLKGTVQVSFHQGMNFYCDEDNTLCISPIKYIDRLIMNYEKLFGETPKPSVFITP
jgi:hypothetical protein